MLVRELYHWNHLIELYQRGVRKTARAAHVKAQDAASGEPRSWFVGVHSGVAGGGARRCVQARQVAADVALRGMQPRRRNAGDQRLRDAANGEQRSRCVDVRAGADGGGARRCVRARQAAAGVVLRGMQPRRRNTGDQRMEAPCCLRP
ncbi:hypothetical protein GUJ93_ZPchr0001g30604 [Zizania palustris]|uniref:Uncharacterized protein n=1 Tax=Zizania palustris TaxID=103762 RepID=A0A8J5RTQ5_ZIZPA|nr:hypothetical protein GUJ93_ZPchr0001g30604 [Zizania palustris]